MNALLAHPDVAVRDRLGALARRAGWTVDTVPDGRTAWQHLQVAPVRLVVLADSLPDIDGRELSRRIRVGRAHADYVLLLVEADAPPACAVEAGADDYIGTPVSDAEFAARLTLAERRLSGNGTRQAAPDQQIRALSHALGVQTAYLGELFESAPEAIAVVDADDRVFAINAEFTRLFGYGADEAYGRLINSLIAPAELFDAAREITVRAARGERLAIETVRAHRDGTRLHVSLLVAPIRVDDHSLGTYAIYRDISGAQRAEAALHRTEQQFRALVEHAPDVIVRLDRDGRFLHVSPAAEAATGLPAAFFIGNRISDLHLPGPLAELWVSSLQQVVNTGQGLHGVEFVYPAPDMDRSFEVHAVPELTVDGRVETVLAIARDTTARKQTEDALRVSETQLRLIVDSLGEGLIISDSAGNIRFVNPQMERISGYTAGELLGQSALDFLVCPEAHAENTVRLDRRLQGQSESYEVPLCRKDGTRIWAEVHGVPHRDIHGHIIGTLAAVTDVTERREAMQARAQFYARMNHELRTPISAVMLYNELLLDGAMGELSPVQAQGVQRAQQAAGHLLELVHDILDLSKIEAGKIELNPAEISFPKLFEELFATTMPLARIRGSELILDCSSGSGPIITDARRLRQILLNLVANAIRFGRSRPIVVRCGSGVAGDVLIEVIDQGVGIAPDDQHRIFDDFVQVGDASEGGTGLGLAISRRLASLLAGTLTVKSVPGEGSTFCLQLPGVLPIRTPRKSNGGPDV